MKPLIGIVAGMTWEVPGIWAKYKKSYVNFDYTDAVERAGGIPVVIPILDNKEVLEAAVEKMDAILICGGQDINPINFNEDPKEKLGMVLEERDFVDTVVIKKALEMNLPLLGICRGHQIINCVMGGTIYQDLSYAPFQCNSHVQEAFSDVLYHTVKIEEGSILKEIFKEENRVNSFHHQIVNKLGEGLKVTARANDGAIEAFESEDKDKFIMGVQFHPEMLAKKYSFHQGIFDRFINEVIKRKEK